MRLDLNFNMTIRKTLSPNANFTIDLNLTINGRPSCYLKIKLKLKLQLTIDLNLNLNLSIEMNLNTST